MRLGMPPRYLLRQCRNARVEGLLPWGFAASGRIWAGPEKLRKQESLGAVANLGGSNRSVGV